MKDSGCRELLRFHFSYLSLFLTNGTPAAYQCSGGSVYILLGYTILC